MGMRTVQLCVITITRINQKPMDLRNIINLLSSVSVRSQAHAHTHTRARVKKEEE